MIKIGILISYDYKFVFECIKHIYDYADEIILAYDKNSQTWSGNTFEIDPTFFTEIKEIDPLKKIKFYSDNFYDKSLSAMKNDTRERNMLSKFMGPDCWQLQIDADEYFLNFDKVVGFLKQHSFYLKQPDKYPLTIRGKWITLFKKTDNGFLYIENDESFSFGTNQVESYNFARDIDCTVLKSNFYCVHQSWAREEEEIYQKVNNWSHKDDFDQNIFFDFWRKVNETNFHEYNNFHPIYPQEWKKLSFIACHSVADFTEKYAQLNQKKINKKTKLPKKHRNRLLKNLLNIR